MPFKTKRSGGRHSHPPLVAYGTFGRAMLSGLRRLVADGVGRSAIQDCSVTRGDLIRAMVNDDWAALSPMLEVIDRGYCTPAHPTPLLFVHGAWHAAWCWDEHFLNFFADKGYRALAVSLRGHGNSPAPRPMQTCSIANYVDDVASVADSLPTRPVVIGHSMGGLVVQKYLESRNPPAGVLVASAPPRGVAGFLMRFMKRHPWRITRLVITTKSLHGVNPPKLAREHFFSTQTAESDVVRYAARLGEEFLGKSTLDMTLLNLPRPHLVSTPLLVLGAERDGCFTLKEVHATARAYRTEAEIFPGMGHDMMLDPGWAAVAERIHTWLGACGL
jgi:pimeloyl-ACP methyl ester carboxylesterase